MGDCLSLASQWLGAGLLILLDAFSSVGMVWLNGVIVAHCSAAIASLDFWTEHNSLYIDGYLRAVAQFGVLAVGICGCLDGTRPDR